MIYECVVCDTRFHYEDGEHKNGYLVCPSCWSEDLRLIEDSLEVDAFEIPIKTLADADFNKNIWWRDEARIKVVDAVINALDPYDKKRLKLYQERNNPCKEVE